MASKKKPIKGMGKDYTAIHHRVESETLTASEEVAFAIT